MYYIVESQKSFLTASKDLENSVSQNGFGVLHIHDLGEKLRSKGLDFKEECHVFEVCNPEQAAKVLNQNMTLNMALPCRISVYTEQGTTKIGMIKPQDMLSQLSDDPAIKDVAEEVEKKTIEMIEGAK